MGEKFVGEKVKKWVKKMCKNYFWVKNLKNFWVKNFAGKKYMGEKFVSQKYLFDLFEGEKKYVNKKYGWKIRFNNL